MAHSQDAGSGRTPATRPGNWETTFTVTDVQIPGMPEEQVSAIRLQMSPPKIESQCVTPEEAADPLDGLAGQGRCNFTHRVFAGGTIDVAGTCREPGQHGDVQLVMTGTYTAETITAQIRTGVSIPQAEAGDPRTLYLAMAFDARRTGSCRGTQ